VLRKPGSGAVPPQYVRVQLVQFGNTQAFELRVQNLLPPRTETQTLEILDAIPVEFAELFLRSVLVLHFS